MKNSILKLSYFIGLTLFIQSHAKAGCVINTDLSCLGATNSPWPAKTKEERLLLVLSSDVQNNPANCSLFGQLIKTECGISKPVIATYFSSNQKKTDTYIISDERELFQNISTLPNTFQKYFNQQLKSTVPYSLLQSYFGKKFEKSAEDFYKFIANENLSDQLEVPFACKASPAITYFCHYAIQCTSTRTDGLGNKLIIKKRPGGSVTCDEERSVNRLVNYLTQVRLPEDEERLNLITEQAEVSNYAGFGHMPVLNQSDAWLSGLFLDKYGVDYTRQGVCVATSAAMMALGLKKESPGSVLQNQFDIVANEYGDGVAIVKDPAKPGLTKQLKYSHYATYIDEMLRWAGLLNDSQKRFPWYFDMYQKVFYKPLINFGTSVPWQSTSLSTASDTMHLNYLANRPLQDFFEGNFKTWISQKKGVVVALQSVGLFMTEKFFEGPVGHASTVASYSGSTITLLDPWGIVNQVKFDVHLDDIGIVQMPEYNECVAAINKLSTELKRIFTITNTCGAPPQNGFSLRAPDPRAMRVLEHVGAQAGYIGRRYIGVRNWYSGAYVNGYIVANRWPAKMPKETFLANQVSKETNLYSNSCTPMTMGQINIEGKWHKFTNPIPAVRAVAGIYSTNYTATSPVEAGCSDMYEYLPDGTLKTTASYLAGTFKLTCLNGKIEVSENSCKTINPICPVDLNAFTVDFIPPSLRLLGLQLYYPSAGQCLHICKPGYEYDSGIKLCKLLPPKNISYPSASYRLAVGTLERITPAPGGSALNATFTVTPALPKGLSLISNFGTITGTPTGVTPPTTYTVKATNTSGSFEFKVVIETFLKPPTLSYTITQYNAKFRQAFNSIALPLKTGDLTKFSITPALPSGLTLSSSGTIVGTPTKQSPSQQYQVSLTNAGGVATSTITLGVYPDPLDIKFPGIVNGLVSTAFTSAPPTVYSTTPIGTTYAAVTALPAGITINPATGVLSGSSPVKIFQLVRISSSNIHGTYSYNDVLLNISSSAAIAPTGLKYLSPTFISVGKSIYLEPALATGTEVGYTVNPSLPVGLNLNPMTGVIRGSVISPIQAKTYRITASNKKGSSYFDLMLEPEVAPVVYANAKLGVEVPASIKPSYVPEGATFSVSPALPQALILNPQTGEIYGFPMVAQASTNYTVSITSGGVTRTSVVAIAIENLTVPSNLTYNLNTLSVRVGTPVNLTPTMSGGGGTLTYTINHTLPDGLSLNPSTGVISGTPTAAKTGDLYTITVQNARGSTSGRIVIEVLP